MQDHCQATRSNRVRTRGIACARVCALLAAGALAGAATPYQVSDVLEGNTGSSNLSLAVTTTAGDVFLAASGRFFLTDGTAGGTRELQLYPVSYPAAAVPFGDRTAVVTDFGDLLLTDWTEEGAVTLKEGVYSSPLLAAPGRLFFFSQAADGTRELWSSDGSPDGTRMLAAVGSPFGPMFDLGDRVVFVAGGLWATDGTPEGTRRLRDDITAIDEERAAIAAPGRMLFVPGAVAPFCAGIGLWVTDGTADGTRLVREFLPTPSDTSPCTAVMREHAAVGDRLVFNGWDATHGLEPWVSDGTPEGTVMLADVKPGTYGSMPADFATAGASAVFFADDGASGREPWATDGTPEQTFLLRDFRAGGEGSSPCVLGTLAGELVLAVRAVPDRTELWATDGTPAGLRMIADLALFSTRPGTTCASFGAPGFLVFVAEDAAHGAEPWTTDGTAAGTRLVRDVRPGSGGSSARDFREGRNGVVVWADDGVHGSEPWTSDGTAEGTAILADLDATPVENPEWCAAPDGRLFFRAYADETGSEPYVTDGTATGTRLCADIRPGAEGSMPAALRPCGTRVLFSADDGEHGEELWASDGTDGDAALLADRPAAPGSAAITRFGTLGDLELFLPDIASARNELWITDGTAAGTRLLRTFTPATPFVSLWHGMELNGRFYFSGNDGVHGTELWVTDGTVEGTRLFLDLAEGADSSWPQVWVRLGDLLFFWAGVGDASPSGCLWQTDGTVDGTRRVCSDGLEELASCPKPFVVLNDRLLCIGERAGIDGDALWSLDGTCGGARFVRDLGVFQLGPRLYGAAEGRCFFEVGIHPWVTDGTAEGTMRVSAKSVMRGVLGGGRFYFVSTDGASGIQGDVWMADGAAEDTESLVYAPPASGYGAPDLFGAERRAFLTKPLGLFQSSRTRGGMYVAHDTDPAVASSFCEFMNKPRSEPIMVGDLLYYWVSESAGGPPRLWAVPLPDSESVFVRGNVNEDGAIDIADPISILNHLFAGQTTTAACADALDVNDDGAVDIADPIWLLSFLFVNGPPPRPPHPEAGFEFTKDRLPGC